MWTAILVTQSKGTILAPPPNWDLTKSGLSRFLICSARWVVCRTVYTRSPYRRQSEPIADCAGYKEVSGMTRTRKLFAVALSTAALAVTAVPFAGANPSPPTNGGNGAGKSGQCTGPNAERPSSCKSQGGPGNQP